MKILHCIFSFTVGGAETMLVDIINQQVHNHEVGLCIINDVYDINLLNKVNRKCKILLLKRTKGSRNIGDIITLNSMIYSFHPNIIHCHNSRIINFLLIRMIYHTIITVHDTQLPLMGVKRFKHIVGISQAVGNDLQKRNIKKYNIIHNGIVTSALSPKTAPFLSNRKQCKILQISRLEHTKKGQHILIEALNILFQKKTLPFVNISVDFIGDGSSLAYLQDLVSKWGLEKSVHFLGIKDRDYIYTHIKDYDILVQPSINEGFGLTVAEGMVVGIPVLVSNIEGPMEIINYGKYGYTFQNAVPLSLAQQIEYMIKHPDETQQLALQGQKYAKMNYDISTMIEKYDQIYSK